MAKCQQPLTSGGTARVVRRRGAFAREVPPTADQLHFRENLTEEFRCLKNFGRRSPTADGGAGTPRGGAREVGRRYGVSHATVLAWVVRAKAGASTAWTSAIVPEAAPPRRTGRTIASSAAY